MSESIAKSLRPTEREEPGEYNLARNWLWLVALLIFAATLRMVFLVGPVGSDDTRYINAAWKLASGQPAGVVDHAYTRAVFIVWLAAWLAMGLDASSVVVISQLILSTALVATVYWLGTKLADQRTGLLAALCWALFPIELIYSGIIAPDHLALLLGTVAGGLALDGLQAEGRRARGYLIGSGILSGLAVSAKEPYALLPFIFFLWAVWRIRPYKVAITRSVAIGVIAVCTFALEYLILRLWTGDWFYRHRALAQAYGAHGLVADGPTTSLTSELIYYPLTFLVFPGEYGYGLYGWLIILAAICCLHKLREPAFVMIWSLCFFLYLQYGSADLGHYTPVPKQARYVHPMVVMLFIPLGRWLMELAASAPFKRLFMLVLITGLTCQALVVANSRIARGLYHASIPQSVESAIAMQASGTVRQVALPVWAENRLTIDLRQKTTGWLTVDLSQGLSSEDAQRLRESRAALLIPNALLKRNQGNPAFESTLQWLALHANNRPLHHLRSPIDRISASIPVLEHKAKRVEIGRLYFLHEYD